MIKFKKKIKKWTVKSQFVMIVVTALSGCSSFSNMVDSTGKSLASAGDSLQSLTGNVQVVQVSESVFELTERYHEPLTGFDSWSMRAKDKQVCHNGYVYQSRHAVRSGEFAKSHAQCVAGQSCGYTLEWRIQCKKVPYEPFSLFGKT